MKVVDISLDTNANEQKESLSTHIDSKCKVNFNFTHSFPASENGASSETNEKSEPAATARQVAPTRSDSITVVKKSESIKWHIEKTAESIKTSSLMESTSCGKASKVEITSTHKSGLSRQDAFSIKPPKTNLQNIDSEQKSENDSKPDNLNEKVETDTSTNKENNAYDPSHSSCNIKCGKNKSVSEKKIGQSKFKKDPNKKRRPQSLKIPRHNEFSVDEPSYLSRIKSQHNVAGNTIPSTEPTLNSNEEASAASVSQSLDLSLSLLLQNFCLSPPLDANKFRLSIDISSDKSNSELKVNISQKETPTESERKASSGSNKNEGSVSKPRKRLSSNSDSRIPRLKKLPNPNRPSSFHGNLSTSKRRDSQAKLNEKHFGRHSTKIPSLKIEGKSPTTQKLKQENDPQSPNDSCFKTPNTTFSHDASNIWMDGSHYLSALATPDDAMANKRESIIKILKHNPGHVLSKVNLFDSKGSSGSESDCKLLRTSSERYSSGSRCTRPKLTVSNSYNGVSRVDSVKYGLTPHKLEHPIPRRMSFKTRDTPLSKRSLTKCTEEKCVAEEDTDESSNIQPPKSEEQK